MNKRTAISIALAVGITAAPLSAARAQTAYQAPYYYNPLFLPFLVVGEALGTAALSHLAGPSGMRRLLATARSLLPILRWSDDTGLSASAGHIRAGLPTRDRLPAAADHLLCPGLRTVSPARPGCAMRRRS